MIEQETEEDITIFLSNHAVDLASLYLHHVWFKTGKPHRMGMFTWTKKFAEKVYEEGTEVDAPMDDQICLEHEGRYYVFVEDMPNHYLLVTFMTGEQYIRKLNNR